LVVALVAGAMIGAVSVASARERHRWPGGGQNGGGTTTTTTTTTQTTQGGGQNGGGNQGGGQTGGQQLIPGPNGLQILGNSCQQSKLTPHDGFEKGDRCVSTAMGEVSTAANNPSLIIAQAPRVVKVGQGFNLVVSTRNLVRDRFLGAAVGGFLVESSFLDTNGLTRGHFHTGCRLLTSRLAPDPSVPLAFFKATEDGGGGRGPDQVTVAVTGFQQAGVAQCAVWAGDGSHRIPMMQNAKEIPAFDSVRILVTN
jgi:hypothetical protein